MKKRMDKFNTKSLSSLKTLNADNLYATNAAIVTETVTSTLNIPVVTALPTGFANQAPGAMYFYSPTNTLYIYSGAAWRTI